MDKTNMAQVEQFLVEASKREGNTNPLSPDVTYVELEDKKYVVLVIPAKEWEKKLMENTANLADKIPGTGIKA